jgi:hypothetical protein
MNFDFDSAVMQKLHEDIVWKQIARVPGEVVMCRLKDGLEAQRSKMELSVYGVEQIDAVFPESVGFFGLPKPTKAVPQTPFENLAAGFPLAVQCLHLEGLR